MTLFIVGSSCLNDAVGVTSVSAVSATGSGTLASCAGKCVGTCCCRSQRTECGVQVDEPQPQCKRRKELLLP
jgi:hypothetical protein